MLFQGIEQETNPKFIREIALAIIAATLPFQGIYFLIYTFLLEHRGELSSERIDKLKMASAVCQIVSYLSLVGVGLMWYNISLYVGVAFAYFVVFPIVFAFLNSYVMEDVTIATDISSYLDFVLTIFFAFGVAFEVPIVAILLCWTGITTPDALIEKRPYIIVGAFVIGMLLTPPDFISQTLLALPMWALFEIGVVFARFYVKDDEADNETDESSTWNDDDDGPPTGPPTGPAMELVLGPTAKRDMRGWGI
jgi:hypothetical protein